MTIIPFPLPGQTKNVLLIGDEGVTIFQSGSRGVQFIEQIEWGLDNFEQRLVRTLRDDCSKAPIVIFYDMVEQHYRKEKVPKVGIMDQKKVLGRKVAVTFPNYRIRAALPLKGGKKESAKAQDQNSPKLQGLPYLFAAVPSSELLASITRAVLASGYPIKGFYLLPVEMSSMVARLSKKIHKNGSSAKWTLFMGQNSSGNLRQVVVRNGQLALTRVTPFSQSQDNTEAWIEEIVQEYKVTISYLSRLGYNPDDGMEVIIVGPEEVSEKMQHHLGESASVTVLGVEEIASQLKLKVASKQDEEYADLLYAAWGGQVSSYVLPMRIKAFDNVTTPRRAVNLLLFLSLGGLGYAAYDTATHGFVAMGISSELSTKQQKLSRAESEYQVLLDEKEDLGYDLRLFKGAFSAREELNEYSLRPFTLLKGTSDSLGPVLNLDKILIRHEDGVNINFDKLDEVPSRARNFSANNSAPTPNGYPVYARLSMTFSSNVTMREANTLLNALVDRLNERLVGYEAGLEKRVRDRSYQVDVEGRIGQTEAAPEIQEDNSAVIEIRGGGA